MTGEPTIKSPESTPKNAISAELRSVDYEKPPVVETSYGFTFAPIKGWSLFHLGLLWSRLRPRYPFREARLPIGSVDVDEVDFKLGPEVHLESLPLRSRFMDSSKNQLLQVQLNRVVRSWKAVEAGQKYFHYSDLKPMFQEDWATFQAFLKDEGLPAPTVFQCDVTYINHFVKGREWNTLDDIEPIFQRIKLDLKDALLTSMSFGASIGDNQLHVDGAPGLRSDGTPIVQLTLNVCGKPAGTSEADLWTKLDECHKLLVGTFAEITADDLQKRVWKRIR